MVVIGWLALLFGGSYLAFNIGVIAALGFMRGGLETVPSAILFGVFCAVVWAGIGIWIAPFSVVITP
jgi:hypothetical protein